MILSRRLLNWKQWIKRASRSNWARIPRADRGVGLWPTILRKRFSAFKRAWKMRSWVLFSFVSAKRLRQRQAWSICRAICSWAIERLWRGCVLFGRLEISGPIGYQRVEVPSRMCVIVQKRAISGSGAKHKRVMFQSSAIRTSSPKQCKKWAIWSS